MTAPVPFRIADHLRAVWLRRLCLAAIQRALDSAGLSGADTSTREAA